jgi:hypothetical protein
MFFKFYFPGTLHAVYFACALFPVKHSGRKYKLVDVFLYGVSLIIISPKFTNIF